MHFIFSPIGSAGDVHPMLGVAVELRRRGHKITFVVNGYFRDLVERYEIPVIELGSKEELLAEAEHPDLWHPRKGFRHIFQRIVRPQMRNQYAALAESFRQGPAVGVVNCFGFGGLAAQDKLGMPVASMHLSPAILWSDIAPPCLPGVIGPHWLRRWMYRLGARMLDRLTLPSLNGFRAELGLRPVEHLMRWWHSPLLVVCPFPSWYAPQQPDWPANVVHTGFPLWDEGADEPLSGEVGEFLAGGDAPLVFTPGSANLFGGPFFRAAADACRRLGRRGILLSRYAAHVPATLPGGVRHFEYVPFRRLLPHAAAVIHHGGIGSLSQGLAAGIPQLIMPLAHDQFDNADRLIGLGVGQSLLPRKFTAARVANRLAQLLGSRQVQEACRLVASRVAVADGLAATADALERLA